MALIKSYRDFHPKVAPTALLAENATVIGDVEIGEGSSVWYQAVLRGDVGPIRIGQRSNIQDGAILHNTKNLTSCIIEDEVVVGHGAILHGCHIHSQALIGMGAIILDLVVVESGCIIAAGALVAPKTRCESGWIYAGNPAKKLKPIEESHEQMIRTSAARYVGVAVEHFGT